MKYRFDESDEDLFLRLAYGWGGAPARKIAQQILRDAKARRFPERPTGFPSAPETARPLSAHLTAASNFDLITGAFSGLPHPGDLSEKELANALKAVFWRSCAAVLDATEELREYRKQRELSARISSWISHAVSSESTIARGIAGTAVVVMAVALIAHFAGQESLPLNPVRPVQLSKIDGGAPDPGSALHTAIDKTVACLRDRGRHAHAEYGDFMVTVTENIPGTDGKTSHELAVKVFFYLRQTAIWFDFSYKNIEMVDDVPIDVHDDKSKKEIEELGSEVAECISNILISTSSTSVSFSSSPAAAQRIK